MNDYYPDCWVVIKIGETKLYKVFATWYGGYGGADVWKLNSGITSASIADSTISFTGVTGSVYHCHTHNYRLSGYGGGVLNNLIERASKELNCIIEVMPGDTNWTKLDYSEEI